MRLGVAPDHPNIKAVSRAFEKIAVHPGFRFLGNVEVGRDVTHAELADLYGAVVYAFGAQTDRRLGIPGEDLPGSWPATAFVAWYNGHPDFQDLEFDLSHERAVVIGNGNVALDVARMLASDAGGAPADRHDGRGDRGDQRCGRPRDRRGGPAWAGSGRLDPVEVGELGDLGGADILVDPAELELDPASEVELEAAPQTVKRNVEHLRSYAARAPEGRPRAIRLRFLRSPVAILGEEKVEAIELVRNELVDGRAVATDDREVIECGIVFRSVGYRGIPLPGVPFDEGSCTVPNDGGRVRDATGAAVPGAYCAGWIKRGPTGVIGTNKKDATETVELLLEDARGGRLGRGEPAAAMDEVLEERGVAVVTQTGWQAIDTAERAAGELQGRPRVKLAEWDALLDAAGHKPASH